MLHDHAATGCAIRVVSSARRRRIFWLEVGQVWVRFPAAYQYPLLAPPGLVPPLN